MLNSTRLKVTDPAAVIRVCVGLFAIYIFANVVTHVWSFGFISISFISDLIFSIVLNRFK